MSEEYGRLLSEQEYSIEDVLDWTMSDRGNTVRQTLVDLAGEEAGGYKVLGLTWWGKVTITPPPSSHFLVQLYEGYP